MDQLPAPQRPGQPWPAPEAAFINSGRSGIGCVLLGAGLLLFFTLCAAAGALWPETMLTDGGSGGTRVIATVIAVLFGALSLFMLASLPKALRTHGLAVDRDGVWCVDRHTAEFVPWQQVRAIGGSFTVRREAPSSSLGSAAGKAIANAALTDKGRQHFAVEVFLHDPGSVDGSRLLSPMQARTRTERPPAPGLPGARLRFLIRGVSDYREMAGHLYRVVPRLWIGEYQR